MRKLIVLKWVVLVVPSVVYTLVATNWEIMQDKVNMEYMLLAVVLMPVTISAFKVKTKVVPLGIMLLTMVVLMKVFYFMVGLLLVLIVSCVIEELLSYKINIIRKEESK